MMMRLSNNPRKRFTLEVARFGLYLLIPVGAVAIYSHPNTMQRLLHSFKFVEYPPEAPKPPSREEITRIMHEREAKREAAAAAREATLHMSKPATERPDGRKRGWFSWFRGGGSSEGPRGSPTTQ